MLGNGVWICLFASSAASQHDTSRMSLTQLELNKLKNLAPLQLQLWPNMAHYSNCAIVPSDLRNTHELNINDHGNSSAMLADLVLTGQVKFAVIP